LASICPFNGAFGQPPSLRQRHQLPEMADGAGLLRQRNAGQMGAVAQPVEAGQDRDREIRRRGAGEIDHGVLVRALEQIGVDHVDLAGSRNQQPELPAGHRHHVLHRFQPGVIPDRADIAGRIRQRPPAGRIDQSSLVDVGEIAGNALAEVIEQSVRSSRTSRRLLHCRALEQLPS